MRNVTLFFLMIFVFFSCKDKSKHTVDVSNISADFVLQRFEIDFYNTTKETLEKTKETYPLFFPVNVPDTVWLEKISDPDERKLYAETIKKYQHTELLKNQLTSLFKHIKYYTSFNVPDVTTIISNIDYDYRVIYNNTSLIISLDCYLGKEHPFYHDYPDYIKENNTENHMIVDVANQIIAKQIPLVNDRSFLGKMVYEGKKMYLLDMYLPNVSDREKIGYSKAKFDWAVANQENVWKYFLDKDILYSTDPKLNKRFLDNAPFSKFYVSQDNLSPGRIGVFIGWQIVKSYMDTNKGTFQELLKIKPQDLFLKSKYKPKR
ncbi:MAG: gliding motility lipoprotein GldB [Flavobacteriaceae bacterium]|nr:MAG: gliding motility lipoprotein GldB [Flavobacteriaceae bacterium]